MHLFNQVTDLLVDESSFTGEAEPCNKTDSVLLEAGDITTLSNVVFMGTLVRYGKGKVSPDITDPLLGVNYITDLLLGINYRLLWCGHEGTGE